MCGIFGRLTGGAPLDPQRCRRQTETLSHRGPDSAGYLCARADSGEHLLVAGQVPQGAAWGGPWDIFLGHRRLAILDLSPAAAQPMADLSRRYWIVFNGEIYNFAEIRRDLASRGLSFRTHHSDTEVLLLAFIQWGEDCLARLRGMFAFAVLDLGARRLFLARDRLGKKPLYYRAAADGLTFASELKAILADPQVPRHLDLAALAQFLAYGYIPAPGTIYQGIAKLPPAHFAWASLDQPGRLAAQRYWDLPAGEAFSSPGDGREEFLAEFTEAVRLRLISDVPLGAFLSGGLDSTLVVRHMQRLSPAPVRTFAVGFPEAEASELPWARQAARRYQTEHHEEIVAPDALALLPRLVRHFDEPFGDSSALPTLVVAETARRRVTVALSGDGGDELLAGYTRYRHAQRLRAFLAAWPAAWRPLALRALARLWPRPWRGKGIMDRAARAPANLYRAIVCREAAGGLLHPDLRRALGRNGHIHGFFDRVWEQGPPDHLDRMQYVDFHTYLPEDILVKTDRASMAVSLELRCPFLDHRVVELAARLPQDLKYGGGELKFLVKQALLPDLGPVFVHRRKTGFHLPLRRWFREDLAPVLHDRLLSRNSPLAGLCDLEAVAALARRFLKGQQDLSEELWRLLVLAEWVVQVHRGREHG